jgi:hypothetical protein
MHEQIPSTVIGGDEAIPLLGREPFHDTFSHFESVLRIRDPGVMPGPNLQKLSLMVAPIAHDASPGCEIPPFG